jgi:hypothetical protein
LILADLEKQQICHSSPSLDQFKSILINKTCQIDSGNTGIILGINSVALMLGGGLKTGVEFAALFEQVDHKAGLTGRNDGRSTFNRL